MHRCTIDEQRRRRERRQRRDNEDEDDEDDEDDDDTVTTLFSRGDMSRYIYNGNDSVGNNNNIPVVLEQRETVTLYFDCTLIIDDDVDNNHKYKSREFGKVVMINDNNELNKMYTKVKEQQYDNNINIPVNNYSCSFILVVPFLLSLVIFV